MNTTIAALAALLATTGLPGSVQKAADSADGTEIYVAQLDPYWTVTKEIRVPCSVEHGCLVDLDLVDATMAHVHVQVDPLKQGQMAVSSTASDDHGHAVAQPDLSIALDRTGFGAAQFEIGPAKAALLSGADGAPSQPIILVAVKAPLWAVPIGSLSRGGDHV